MNILPDFKQKDKQGHLLMGAIVAALFSVLFYAEDMLLVFCVGFGASVLVGASKELLDALDNWHRRLYGLKPRHTVDIKDFIATAAGGLIVSLFLMIGSL